MSRKLLPEAPGNQTESTPDVVGWLYDVATDPPQIEFLVDQWEIMVRSLHSEADFQRPRVLDDATTMKHADRAVTILHRFDATDASVETEVAAFGHIPCFVVDRALNVIVANGAGQELMDGLGEVRLPIHENETDTLTQTVADVLAEQPRRCHTLKVSSPRDGRTTLLSIKALHSIDGPPRAIIALNEVGWPDGFDAVLEFAFELTKGEIAVVRGIIAYGALGDIAAARKRSMHTVRNQLKSVLAKTESRSQVELVRKVMSLMDLDQTLTNRVPDPYQGTPQGRTLSPIPFKVLARPGGRTIQYMVTGDPRGRPVLTYTSDFAVLRSTAVIENYAAKLGLKIVLPLRPGYGESDPIAKGQDFDEGLIDDAIAVLATEGGGPCPVLSYGADSYYAIRTAHRHPDQIQAVAAVAGILPFDRREQIERMAKWHKFLVGAARYTPHLAPFFVRACFAMARRMGERKFLESVYASSAPDMAALQRPEVFEAMSWPAPLVLARNGHVEDSFLHQLVDRHKFDWRHIAKEVTETYPVQFWWGAHDPLLPPDTVAEFQEDYPSATFAHYPNAGGLLFFDAWKDVLDTVAQWSAPPPKP